MQHEQPKDEISSDLRMFRIADAPLFVVGTFDSGVTVLSQQIRALNLVLALVESEFVPCSGGGGISKKVAIVGGGFAGLTAAAGLIKKSANVEITIFEERDTLLPLQQGSDTRWLHPHIYDWPGDGSESGVAMLPVLNWTAARASDVVVQILTEWKRTAAARAGLRLFCNARHLQVHDAPEHSDRLQIEWVGEGRDPSDGTSKGDPQMTAVGASESFDVVILAVGFGLERDGTLSYWRNETLGQPSLDQPRRTYLVSGQGDGAMIDLLRLRISQFRQDRILEELFLGKSALLKDVKALHKKYTTDIRSTGLFDDLEKLAKPNSACEGEFTQVLEGLRRRLRRDTEVVLRLQVRKFSELFDPENTRISFQNRLLVYLLYKCGGFFPSSSKERDITEQHAISHDRIVRRHGTHRDEQLKRVLSSTLYDAINQRRGGATPDPFSQSDRIMWPGGYFGYPGASRNAGDLEDSERQHWRKEYLPGPTALLGAVLCTSLVGALRHAHTDTERLRVTLHRAVPIANEELLQQTCDYLGVSNTRGEDSTAARTFPTSNATIGLAYRCRKIARSRAGVDPEKIRAAMASLNLHAASRSMSDGVSFVLAIPLLEPDEKYTLHRPVAGVIYIDSKAERFFVDDDELRGLVLMIQEFLDGLERSPRDAFDRIRNLPLTGLSNMAPPTEDLPDAVADVIELVGTVAPPRTSKPFQFNYDYSDIVPIQ
jgi:hypothetical protein